MTSTKKPTKTTRKAAPSPSSGDPIHSDTPLMVVAHEAPVDAFEEEPVEGATDGSAEGEPSVAPSQGARKPARSVKRKAAVGQSVDVQKESAASSEISDVVSGPTTSSEMGEGPGATEPASKEIREALGSDEGSGSSGLARPKTARRRKTLASAAGGNESDLAGGENTSSEIRASGDEDSMLEKGTDCPVEAEAKPAKGKKKRSVPTQDDDDNRGKGKKSRCIPEPQAVDPKNQGGLDADKASGNNLHDHSDGPAISVQTLFPENDERITKDDVIAVMHGLRLSVRDLLLQHKKASEMPGKATRYVKFSRQVTSEVKAATGIALRFLKQRHRRLPGAVPRKSGLDRPCRISDKLCNFMGVEYGSFRSRSEVTKALCKYIKERELQIQDERRYLLADACMSELFDVEVGFRITFPMLQKLLKERRHFLPDTIEGIAVSV